MKPEKNIDKLNKIISKEKSGWHEDAKRREENEVWLEYSFKIALRILNTLKAKSITQKELAERMNVSPQHINKIIKGQENLSLETISKLELALNVQLITISSSKVIAVDIEYKEHGGTIRTSKMVIKQISSNSMSYFDLNVEIDTYKASTATYNLEQAA